MTVPEKLIILRKLMKEHGMSAYIIPSSDFHGSEYVGDHFKARSYTSGFTGSAGTLVVTEEDAGLWTDGRYFLQAGRQLEGSGIQLMKMGEAEVPTIEEFLAEKLGENTVIGFDGRTVSCQFAASLSEKTAKKNITLNGSTDLVDQIWTDRPAISAEKVWELDKSYCRPRPDKLAEIRKAMLKNDCELLLVTSLEETAWLLNLRGNDVACTPVFLAYMLISPDKAQVYANKDIFSAAIAEKLHSDGIDILPYQSINEAVRAECVGKCVWADDSKANFALMEDMKAASRIIRKPTPIELMKAVKSEAEQEGMRKAHIRDGVAVTRFMFWLKTHVGKEKITELSAAEKLLEFRKEQEGFVEPSFATILAYADHGAIVHYSATQETDREILPKSLCLVDSGGHYSDGSTDITRTIAVGELTEEEKRAFTLVLKSHLQLGAVRFKYGTSGSVLDIQAREPLWMEGLDFNHGTGHGVGFILSVHEGPHRISNKGKDTLVPLEAGMITSNEPGLYFAGKFGIRHENLMLCKKAEKNEYGQFMCLESLTMVPFDRDGIDASMLSDTDKQRLNAYHKQVRDTVSPFLEGEEKQWLIDATAEI